MSTDQWKSDGDCGDCRRQLYCGDECKAHKMRREFVISKKTEEFLKWLGESIKRADEKLKEKPSEDTGKETAGNDDQHMESGMDNTDGACGWDADGSACVGEPGGAGLEG